MFCWNDYLVHNMNYTMYTENKKALRTRVSHLSYFAKYKICLHKFNVNLWALLHGHFLLHGHISKKIGRESLHDVTYQTRKSRAFKVLTTNMFEYCTFKTPFLALRHNNASNRSQSLNKFGRGPPKDHSCAVWLKFSQWFLRRCLSENVVV